jgi:hypothetical protein
MANMIPFNIGLRTVTANTFDISLGSQVTAGGGFVFNPPTVNQIYPRADYYVGSSYGVVTGQLWPRGTGHQF